MYDVPAVWLFTDSHMPISAYLGYLYLEHPRSGITVEDSPLYEFH